MFESLIQEPIALELDEPPMPKWDQDEFMRAATPTADWIACHFPERPIDMHTSFHDCCRACLIAAQAGEVNGVRLVNPLGEDIITVMISRLEQWGEAPDD